MELELRIEEATHLEAMLHSQGWKIVEDEVQARLNGDGGLRPGLIKMLIQSNDMEQIRDLQANIRSLEFLLTFPLQMVGAAQKAIEKAKEASQTDSATTGE